MKYTFRFFALAVLAAIALTSQAQEVKVTGYQPGYIEVTSDMEQQLNANVVKPIGLAMTHADGGDLQIFVKGYADKTGSGKENQHIALDRAEQVKEFLLEQFPKATITNRTKGDDANARMVTISWKFTAAPPTPMPQQKKSNSGMIALVAVIGIAIVIIIAVVVRPKATQPVQLAPPPQAVEAIPVATEPEINWVRTENSGGTHDVRIEFKDGMWHTPFPTQKDPTQFIFRKTLRDVVKAVKACMANPFYASTIKQSIANETIKVVQAQGEES